MSQQTTPEPDDYRSPTWMPIDLVIGVIQCISCSICLIYAICVVRRGTSSLPMKFNIVTIIAIISFLISSISITINGYYWNMIYWTYTSPQYNSWHISWLSWSFGQCLSYYLFIDRLKLTFINTCYELSDRKRILLRCILSIYAIIWIISTCIPLVILNTNVTTNDNMAEQEMWQVQYFLTIGMVSIDIIITSVITYMFISRLYKLDELDKLSKMEAIVLHSTESVVPSPVVNNIRLSEFKKLSTKITILAVVSLISSFLTVSFRTLSYFYVFNDHYEHTEELYGIFGNAVVIWLQIDTVISCICLILFLPNHYNTI